MTRPSIVRWSLSLLILAFGVASDDPKTTSRWFILAVAVYAIPLVAQLVPRNWVKVYGIYVGLFVLLQAVISAHFFPDTYITRPPHMNSYFDVRGDNLYGINGLQHKTTDGKGFHRTKPINYDAKGDYRIIFIGASTVAEHYIGDKKTFPHLVQESPSKSLGRNVEVINTAVPGLRAVHHLETMRRVARYHLDMYVIVPGANDWGLQITLNCDNQNPNRFVHGVVNDDEPRFRVRLVAQACRYTLRHTLLGRFARAVVPLVSSMLGETPVGYGNNPERTVYNAPWYKANRGSLYWKDKRTYKPKSVHFGYKIWMNKIVEFCQNSPATCVFVTHPHSCKPGTTKAYRDRFWMTPAFESYPLTFESMAQIASMYSRFLIDLGKKSGVPVCDLEASLPPSLENFYDEIHVNIESARKAGVFLHDYLIEVIRSKEAKK